MTTKKTDNTSNQQGGVTHKKDSNAGSTAFNQGAQQDPDYDKGTPVRAEEKKERNVPVADNKKERVEGDGPSDNDAE